MLRFVRRQLLFDVFLQIGEDGGKIVLKKPLEKIKLGHRRDADRFAVVGVHETEKIRRTGKGIEMMFGLCLSQRIVRFVNEFAGPFVQIRDGLDKNGEKFVDVAT